MTKHYVRIIRVHRPDTINVYRPRTFGDAVDDFLCGCFILVAIAFGIYCFL